MDIFIGNLPGRATVAELHKLLGDVRLTADFTCCRGRDQQQRDYHFIIAHSVTDAEGRALIDRLDGADFEQQTLVAREYVQRNEQASWQGEERRLHDAPQILSREAGE